MNSLHIQLLFFLDFFLLKACTYCNAIQFYLANTTTTTKTRTTRQQQIRGTLALTDLLGRLLRKPTGFFLN